MRLNRLKGILCSAGVLAITTMTAAVLRGTASRIFIGRFAVNWTAQIVLSIFVATTWIALYWLVSSIHLIAGRLPFRAQTSEVGRVVAFALRLGKAFGLAFAFAITVFLALTISDEVFFSRLLHWDLPLIHVQYAGFLASSRFFPCRLESSSLGCEPYKTLPVFLLANLFVYLPFMAAVVFLSESSHRASEIARAGFRIYCRIAAVVGFPCLMATVVLWQFGWADGTFPYSHIHRQIFEIIDYSGGTTVVSASFLVVFLLLRLAQRGGDEMLPEMTWLGCSLMGALQLGNRFLV